MVSPQTEKIEDDVDDVNAKKEYCFIRFVGDFAPPALPDAVTTVAIIMDKEKEYVRTTINRNETCENPELEKQQINSSVSSKD